MNPGPVEEGASWWSNLYFVSASAISDFTFSPFNNAYGILAAAVQSNMRIRGANALAVKVALRASFSYMDPGLRRDDENFIGRFNAGIVLMAVSTRSLMMVRLARTRLDFTASKNRHFLAMLSIAMTSKPKIAKTTAGNPAPLPRSITILPCGMWAASWAESKIWRPRISSSVDGATRFILSFHSRKSCS